jgi:hypothetical protein
MFLVSGFHCVSPLCSQQPLPFFQQQQQQQQQRKQKQRQDVNACKPLRQLLLISLHTKKAI